LSNYFFCNRHVFCCSVSIRRFQFEERSIISESASFLTAEKWMLFSRKYCLSGRTRFQFSSILIFLNIMCLLFSSGQFLPNKMILLSSRRCLFFGSSFLLSGRKLLSAGDSVPQSKTEHFFRR
jgi:hypothetical protein